MVEFKLFTERGELMVAAKNMGNGYRMDELNGCRQL